MAVNACPYCGEDDLRPEPEPRGAWRCAGCTRVFVVTFVGLSVGGPVGAGASLRPGGLRGLE
ncbi:Insertion element protein [Leekyejoonella antrihumi]|uniref:Insertion element protein n=1 Tax=Leekyejoonella antrihumi TaxID=1660198 RepID=A0A563DVX8_9MICO|nr:Insertion element protein [Leekyejoonella antrihumi]